MIRSCLVVPVSAFLLLVTGCSIHEGYKRDIDHERWSLIDSLRRCEKEATEAEYCTSALGYEKKMKLLGIKLEDVGMTKERLDRLEWAANREVYVDHLRTFRVDVWHRYQIRRDLLERIQLSVAGGWYTHADLWTDQRELAIFHLSLTSRITADDILHVRGNARKLSVRDLIIKQRRNPKYAQDVHFALVIADDFQSGRYSYAEFATTPNEVAGIVREARKGEARRLLRTVSSNFSSPSDFQDLMKKYGFTPQDIGETEESVAKVLLSHRQFLIERCQKDILKTFKAGDEQKFDACSKI
jgi:hypothetical protein